MDRRILELAMEALLMKKAEIDQQISEVSAQLDDGNGTAKAAEPARKRRQMSAAQRKAISLKMKAAWTKRKAAKK
jgi:hypothetical protein